RFAARDCCRYCLHGQETRVPGPQPGFHAGRGDARGLSRRFAEQELLAIVILPPAPPAGRGEEDLLRAGAEGQSGAGQSFLITHRKGRKGHEGSKSFSCAALVAWSCRCERPTRTLS